MRTMGFITQETIAIKQTQNNLVPQNFMHAHAIGQTGCGKTTSFIYPNLEDRIKLGHSVLLYDFKGKEHMALKYFAHKHNRLNDVVEIGKPWGSKINIIRLFDEASLKTYLTNAMGHSKDNSYWSKISVSIALGIYEVIRNIEAFLDASTCVGLHPIYLMEADKEYPYDYTLSFSTLYDICKSSKSLSVYSQQAQNFYTTVLKNMPKILKDQGAKSIKSKEVVKFVHCFNVLKGSIDNLKQILSEFSDNKSKQQKSTTFQTIALSLGLPLVDIAGYKELNEDDIDILKALNNKALISIDAQMMTDTMLTSLNYAFFSQFTQRKMLLQMQPISIFIDEAQRILSDDDDVPIDVLRECKVELILSYQNEDLMIKKLGEVNYEALRKNLSHTVLYTNPSSNDIQTSKLDAFEFYSNKDNFYNKEKAQTIFIEESSLFEVEYIYQNDILKLPLQYTLDKDIKNSVFVFSAKEYMKNKMVLVDVKTLAPSLSGYMLITDHNIALEMLQTLTFKKIEELDTIDDDEISFDIKMTRTKMERVWKEIGNFSKKNDSKIENTSKKRRLA